MNLPMVLPKYDPLQSYQWNYENAPEPVDENPPLDLIYTVNDAYAGVAQRRGRLRLVHKARPVLFACDASEWQKLQRDGAAQVEIVRLVDVAHAAHPEQLEDLIVTERPADHFLCQSPRFRKTRALELFSGWPL